MFESETNPVGLFFTGGGVTGKCDVLVCLVFFLPVSPRC